MQVKEEGGAPNQQHLLLRGEASVSVQRSEQKDSTAEMDPVDGQSSKLSRLVSKLMPSGLCPAPTRLHAFVSRLEIGTMMCALVYVMVSLPWASSVRSAVLQLTMLGALAWACGHAAALLRLPPLLGMLLAGMLLRNTGQFHAEGTFQDVVATLRVMAMTVILLKAGLGLDAGALRRLSMVVLRLAVFPCCVEAISVGIIAHFLLGFPWLWGLLLGCVLGAESTAVVVPTLLDLKARGYGEDKGISTLVIAASSLDNILAISLFGVFLSTIFSTGSLTQQLLQGPLEVVLGLIWGVTMGVIAIYIPHHDDDFVVGGRLMMLGGSGLMAVLGSPLVGYPGAGPLACIVCAFVACCGWKAVGKPSTYMPVIDCVSGLWLIFQPILFGLIGTEIDLSKLDGNTVGFGVVVIIVGLVFRVLTCTAAVQGAGLTPREVLFLSIAWFPKATVQAAIGPVALDLARKVTDGKKEETLFLAHAVLTTAVLSILLSAPLGAMGILCFGPRLLNRSETEDTLAQISTPCVEDISQDRGTHSAGQYGSV